MRRSTRTTSPARTTSSLLLIAFLFLGLFSFTIAASSNSPAAPSPPTDVELICHTGNPTECYPKIFQATHEFQKVHHDQDLPTGLHVRLNINTGQKEAKINVPDEKDASLEGLPVDQSVILVDPEPEAAPDEHHIPAGAPKYEPAGKVKAPTDESVLFYDALKVIRKGAARNGFSPLADVNGTGFIDAIDVVEELSHDIYYGVKLAEDTEALRELLCAMSTDDVFSATAEDDDLAIIADFARGAAASVAAAVQNNPTALKEVEKSWAELMGSECASRVGKAKTLDKLIFSSLLEGSGEEDTSGSTFEIIRAPSPGLLKARISAIDGLLKSDRVKDDFLAAQSAMDQILGVMLLEDTEILRYEAARRKAANLVMDNFLDEAMGATLGKWPTKLALEGKGDDAPVSESYFDHHIGLLSARHGKNKGHWSHDLSRMLQEQRSAGGKKKGGGGSGGGGKEEL